MSTERRPDRQAAQAEFLSMLSHELRTPLAAILGWTHVLERGRDDPQLLAQGLAAIARNAQAQVGLIDELLDLHRLQCGLLAVEARPLDLAACVAEAIDAAVPAAAGRDIRIRSIAAASRLEVLADAARLGQVLAKLLVHAIRGAASGNEVCAALGRAGSMAFVSISDHGPDPAPLPAAEPAPDEAKEASSSGAGPSPVSAMAARPGALVLGLEWAERLAWLQGGRLHVQCGAAGCRYVLAVPLAACGEGAQGPPRAAPPVAGARTPASASPEGSSSRGRAARRTALKGLTVLVIDDEPDVRALTVWTLEQAGAQVFAAANAGEGLDLLRHEKPAVMLSDIGMPAVDGYDLMRRVRELPAEEGGRTPAVAFTAHAGPGDAERALEVGYQAHLAKPVPPASLIATVAHVASMAGMAGTTAGVAGSIRGTREQRPAKADDGEPQLKRPS